MKSEPPSMAEKSRLSSREKFIGALSLGQGLTIKAARFSGPGGDGTVAVWHIGISSGKRLHFVHFAGPIKPEWVEALWQNGVEIVT